jgi:serine/threonine protein phosphatase PrpC
VTAVLRRCNNAPKAISAGMGGGIKRVAGSLAVTRALGDAYLKTPKLSFLPYKKHAPYITARPEVNCRLLVKEGDKVLILATDVCYSKT